MTLELETPLISQTLLDDLARLSLKYGHHKRWTPEAYFELNGNYLVEYTRGRIEVLPMPATDHQRSLQRMFKILDAYVSAHDPGGEVFIAPTRVKIDVDAFREPDLTYVPSKCSHLIHQQFVEKPELLVEVLSESNRDHDLVTKRVEYARAQIPEYWIIDPQFAVVTVLTLDGATYRVHAEFRTGERASSPLLRGFEVDVAFLFAKS
jgi:Uma2 family endonuclease